jgi:predicted ATP-grasp superfamily ATP-dependent carboligase
MIGAQCNRFRPVPQRTTGEKRMEDDNLLLFGASTRAAAFSALRAGLRPWCCDLFADADLQARCPVTRLRGRYPHGFLDVIDRDLPGPWMYTGGLENWPALVDRMARRRRLWGNDGETLWRIRSPREWTHALKAAGLPAPDICLSLPGQQASGLWLLKPKRGAGGVKIRFWTHAKALGKDFFLQEYIEGESWAALFAAIDGQAALLGVTRQLVGEPWLHAAAFHYCGSVGPLSLGPALRRRLELLGNVLARSFSLRGLFGVDGVVRGDDFYPVEINPRYTASVEVLECATGLSAIGWHRQAFAPTAPPARPALPSRIVGKAILFAREGLTFPSDGPWRSTETDPLCQTPRYADIPHAGERIEAGRPVLTCFAQAESLPACLDVLRQTADEMDLRLLGR